MPLALRMRRLMIRGGLGAAPQQKDERELVFGVSSFWFGCAPARYFWEGGLLVGGELCSFQAALMPR